MNSDSYCPEGWTAGQLGDFVIHIQGGGTPSRKEPKYWNGDIPWATVKDLRDGQALLHETQEHITRSGLENSSASLIPAGTPVLCTRMAVGRVVLPQRPVAINQDLKALIPGSCLTEAYLHRLLQHRRPRLEAIAVGSTVKGVRLSDVRRLPVILPSVPEQRRIAEVLDTVDAAIQQTDAVIAKQQQVKTGLLQDLLTRGLDEQGRLRDPERHPEQFKDSPLGRIPKAWGMQPLGSLAAINSGITINRSKTKKDAVEVPYLRVANVQDGYLDLEEVKTVRVSQSKLSRYLLRTGDVLMTEGGDYDKLGRGTVWKGQITSCCHQNHLFSVRTEQELLRPEYLSALTSSDYGKRYFVRISKQTTNLATINQTQLRSFPVPRPSPEEQDAILAVIRSAEHRIECERKHHGKLQRLKSGLMQDLLTGKVRVPDAEAVVQEVIA